MDELTATCSCGAALTLKGMGLHAMTNLLERWLDHGCGAPAEAEPPACQDCDHNWAYHHACTGIASYTGDAAAPYCTCKRFVHP